MVPQLLLATSRSRRSIPAGRLLTLIVLAGTAASPALNAADPTLPDWKTRVQPLLRKLCYECHGIDSQKAELRVDALTGDVTRGRDLETWHDVLNRVNLGEMPPADSPQPTVQERKLLVDWLQGSLRRAAESHRHADGRVIMRRLTRYEYQNTLRDLLGVRLDFASGLPPEPRSPDGFLNNGRSLEMSPLQMETALAMARRGLDVAIVSGEKPVVYTHHAEATAVGRLPTRNVGKHQPVNPEYLVDLREFPRTGEFELKIRAGAVVPPGQGYPRMRISLGCVPGIVHVPRKLLAEVDVTAPVDDPQTFTFRGRIEDFPQTGDRPFGNVDFKGMIALIDYLDADGNELRYADQTYVVPPNQKKKKKTGKKQKSKKADASAMTESAKESEDRKAARANRLNIVIQSAEFEAPLLPDWPPASHTRILFPSELDRESPAYLREVLTRFMTRAFRRPVTPGELDRTQTLFDLLRPQSASYEEALRETLSSVLLSPHFLYIVETREEVSAAQDSHETPGPDGNATPRRQLRLTNHELASRLSYFLWSTMPDDRLLELATAKKLTDSNVLREEVLRMLQDDRAEEFLQRFADQWFDLDALDRVAINPEFFPDFDPELKNHMRNQTREFFAEVVRGDGTALALIDSDWTMLNHPLAAHYGIPGPRSLRFERVALPPESRRGGLLGQGAFLLSNSNGESSHPIKRAVWILDRLLDSPPAPPPPDVPELDPDSADLAGLSLKRQLEVHRDKEACANCHRGIDPWGIPLERFDAVGLRHRLTATLPTAAGKQPAAKRSGENSSGRKTKPKSKVAAAEPIDATSQLPDGTQIDGVEDLKKYLLTRRREQFARAVVRRLSAYALGRSLDLGDRPEIEKLTQQFQSSEFRMQALIADLVQSDLFQTK